MAEWLRGYRYFGLYVSTYLAFETSQGSIHFDLVTDLSAGLDLTLLELALSTSRSPLKAGKVK